MNHKRKRPKNRRAGCLLCKPHKGNDMKGRSKFQALGERRGRDSALLQLRELDRGYIRHVLTDAESVLLIAKDRQRHPPNAMRTASSP